MASKQTYTDYANAATQTLVQNWFPPNGPSTWIQTYQDIWHVPNVVTALTRLSKLTGTWNYESTADNAQQMFNNYFYPQRGLPSYYDDECWWGDLFNRLYSLTGASQWTTAANQVFVDLQGGWDDAAKGGVWWKRNPKSYPGNNKGSIENELYMAIAMALYNAPPSDTDPGVYLSATTQTLQWLGNLIDKTGMVWGNLDQNGNINPSNVPRPYTQGVILGALWDLFQQSNLTSYLDTAQQIADAAIANMIWPDGILQDNCEKWAIVVTIKIRSFSKEYTLGVWGNSLSIWQLLAIRRMFRLRNAIQRSSNRTPTQSGQIIQVGHSEWIGIRRVRITSQPGCRCTMVRSRVRPSTYS